MSRLLSRFAVVVAVLCLNASLARAQPQEVIDRVKSKIESESFAKDCLFWIHTGSTSLGAEVRSVNEVVDLATGQVVPNNFKMNVRYNWDFLGTKKGYTEIWLYFDGNGEFLQFRNGSTTAALLKHFDEAKILKGFAKLAVQLIDDDDLRRSLDYLISNVSVEKAFAAKLQNDFRR